MILIVKCEKLEIQLSIEAENMRADIPYVNCSDYL